MTTEERAERYNRLRFLTWWRRNREVFRTCHYGQLEMIEAAWNAGKAEAKQELEMMGMAVFAAYQLLETHGLTVSDKAWERVQNLRDASELAEAERWVSVEERLPEIDDEDAPDSVRVLVRFIRYGPVTGDYATCTAATYDHESGAWDLDWNDGSPSRRIRVTHWQPMPAPPQEADG